MITIKQLSELAKVSTTTVSNVIHGKTEKVSPEKEAEIKELIRKYNYVPNMGLRVLAKKNSQIIGVVIFTHNNTDRILLKGPHHVEIISALERLLHDYDYFMMLYCSDNIHDIYKMVGGWNVDGVIALSCEGADYQKLSEVTDKPIVGIDMQTEPDCFSYQVGINNSMACYKMVHRLLELGYRNFRIFLFKNMGLEHMRWQGCHQALREGNITCDRVLNTLGVTKEQRLQQYLAMAQKASKDEVWVFFSDENALEAMGCLQNHGYRIPEQIGIVGFDDIDSASDSYPPLTTIHQDIARKAKIAWEMLWQRISGQTVEESRVILRTSIIERSSTHKIQ